MANSVWLAVGRGEVRKPESSEDFDPSAAAAAEEEKGGLLAAATVTGFVLVFLCVHWAL
jgi:hypothetical protein